MAAVFTRLLWVRLASYTNSSGEQSWLDVRALPTYCLVKLQRLVAVTPTVKLTEPLPVFPALSVAVARKVFVPSAKLAAEPVMLAQVLEAMLESASVAAQVMFTVWSTL